MTSATEEIQRPKFPVFLCRGKIVGFGAIAMGLLVFVWAVYTHHLNREAHTLYSESLERDDQPALAVASERFAALLLLQPRALVPLDCAATQSNLGMVLTSLGKRENGTARLEEAVAAYRAALQIYASEHAPLQWAMIESNLGTALRVIGEREGGTARLEAAVAAYQAALQVYTYERAPLRWAETQNSLGLVLWRIGERESGTARLEEAVAAFQAALRERTREGAPLRWAMTQSALAFALVSLGERKVAAEQLEEAVAAYDSALPILNSANNESYTDICRKNRERAIALLKEIQDPDITKQ